MDHCASVLLAFPTEEASTADNEKYNKAVKAHISNINSLFKERSAVIGDNAYKLLDVCNSGVLWRAIMVWQVCWSSSADNACSFAHVAAQPGDKLVIIPLSTCGFTAARYEERRI